MSVPLCKKRTNGRRVKVIAVAINSARITSRACELSNRSVRTRNRAITRQSAQSLDVPYANRCFVHKRAQFEKSALHPALFQGAVIRSATSFRSWIGQTHREH